MSRATELAELQHLIGSLRRCVSSLQHRYSDSPAMRRVLIDTDRIVGDLDLLEIDAGELEFNAHTPAGSSEKIGIPDAPYDREFWRDVEDEGLGGQVRR